MQSTKNYYQPVFRSLFRFLLDTFFLAAVLGAGYYILIASNDAHGLIVVWAVLGLILGVPLFGLGFVLLGQSLLNSLIHKPVLILSDKGVVNNTTIGYRGLFVPWAECLSVNELDQNMVAPRSVVTLTKHKQQFKWICLNLKRPLESAIEISSFKQRFTRPDSRKMNRNVMMINLAFVKGDAEEIVRDISALSGGSVTRAVDEQVTDNLIPQNNVTSADTVDAPGEPPQATPPVS